MIHRLRPIHPNQSATDGALDIFVEAHQAGNIPRMLIGLAVLSSAPAAQITAAMPFVQARQGVSAETIAGMLAG